MKLGYNTNGLAHHSLLDAIELLAELGYRSVAITVDHGALAPDDPQTEQQLPAVRRLLARWDMSSVIETGARYLLDPRRKHEPTLVSGDDEQRTRRAAFYRHCIRMAAELGSRCVSVWSGVVHDGASRQEATERLVEGLEETLDCAAAHGVRIGLEPEPGMLVATVKDYAALIKRLGDNRLGLTLDVGHVFCQKEGPVDAIIRRVARQLINVHLDDSRAGIHEHLMFGEGEMEFAPIFEALNDVGYKAGVHVELSRHSHEAPVAARRAIEFLSQYAGSGE